MTDPGVQHPIIPAAQTPIIGITVDLVVPCKVVFFERLHKFFSTKMVANLKLYLPLHTIVLFLKNATKVSFLCMILENVSRMDIHVYIQMDPHVARAGSKKLALVCHVMKLD